MNSNTINTLHELVESTLAGLAPSGSFRRDILRDCVFCGEMSTLHENQAEKVLIEHGWGNQPEEDRAEYLQVLRSRLERAQAEIERSLELFDDPVKLALVQART